MPDVRRVWLREYTACAMSDAPRDNIRYFVIRRPVLMEDEGHYHDVAPVFSTETEARDWVRAREGQFFHPSDYVVTVELDNA